MTLTRDEQLGCAFYLAMYEKDGAKWSANDHQDLWIAKARDYERRRAAPAQGMTDADGVAWFERTFGVPLGDKPGAVDVARVKTALATPQLAAQSDAVMEALSDLREEYRKSMNRACDQAQEFAQSEEMDRVSEFSTESERKREAFTALNRAIKLIDEHFDAALSAPRPAPVSSGQQAVDREDLGAFLDSKFGLIDDPWEIADGILKQYDVTLKGGSQEVNEENSNG